MPPIAHTWIKAIAAIPDDQALHCAVLAYASDATLLDIACYPHGVSWISPKVQQASLSHGMWFHRPFRIDEWLLYSQHVVSSAGGSHTATCSRATARSSRRWCRKGSRRLSPVIPRSEGDRRCRARNRQAGR